VGEGDHEVELMTDVYLFSTPDGGEIDANNGRLTMSDGLDTAVYLSLFGGNEDDSGSDGDARKQWWGNLSETDPPRQYRSETQHLLKSLPLIPASLRRIEDAAKRDLAWMVPSPARAVDARATIPALNTVRLELAVDIDGTVFSFTFTEHGTR
jgi:phage gp46-like protein